MFMKRSANWDGPLSILHDLYSAYVSFIDGFEMTLLHGMCLNPLTLQWSWQENTDVNYAARFIKHPAATSEATSELSSATTTELT